MRDIELNEKNNYIQSLLEPESARLLQSRIAAVDLGLSRISVSPVEGKLIQFLLKSLNAKKVVEIGTLTGVSAQYILKSLPQNGQLWSLEKSEIHAEKTKQILIQDSRFQLIQGDAVETLKQIQKEGPFDACFIDGNKAAYGKYLDWCEAHIKSGGLIIADNVFLSGAVWGQPTAQRFSEKQIKVMQEFNLRLAQEDKYESVLIPTEEGLFAAIKKF